MKSRQTSAACASLLMLLSLATQGDARLAAQNAQGPPRPAPVPARQQPPQQDLPPDSEDEVVRISSNLVQIDAVVTDEKGNRVEDLRPEDFEVDVNKRAQEITNFSYFKDAPTAAGSPRRADATRQPDPKNLAVGSRLSLGGEFPPGEYVLQVFVTDALAEGNHATASQWIDFQVVE